MGRGLGKARPGKSGIMLERKSEARAWDLLVSGVKGLKKEGGSLSVGAGVWQGHNRIMGMIKVRQRNRPLNSGEVVKSG